ncbi:MAG TPA: FAD-dependent oxidoreductase [Paludibacter sp.]
MKKHFFNFRKTVTALFLFLVIMSAKAYDFDVVIYGATASGVTAAVAASNEGMKVLLIEPGSNIGGMVTGGLSNSDLGNTVVIGGLTWQFYKECADFYHAELFHWPGPEPHVAEKIMTDWLKKNKVTVWFEKKVNRVIKPDKRIEKIILSDNSEVTAQVFIDAGYEGDLMARSGVSYTWGREGRKDYNESYAGLQPVSFTSHQIDTKLNPFDKNGKLLPLINNRKQVEYGEADKGIQSYCFRMVITDVPENKLAWTKPSNYRPETYELARRYYVSKPDAPALFRFWPALPNRKCDVNSSIGISTNLLDGSNWDYPEANYAKRDSIWQWHKDYTLGLVWFLRTDSVVPQQVKDFVKSVGLCKDEFTNTANFPHQLYVREARRMKGEYFMTQHDLMKDTTKYDAIGMGSYNIDIREMQRVPVKFSRYPKLEDEVYNEGYMSIPVSPYQIPYRSIVPKYTECQNLIVPVCISASHVAFASFRMEPQFMIVGQSAGIAAAMAVKSKRPVQQIDIFELQNKLRKSGQIVSFAK